ncbi:MAG: DUF4115 domain-containing protein [Candidatus Solibacter usitatus]|nr:DUF4115 domain-containing protein [Candidatus Solibacter usitatus]
MASVGEILRSERERQGLDLGEIAELLKIKQSYLVALERDEMDQIPGRFFARSFATQYAEKLGVNTPELQEALLRQAEPVDIFKDLPLEPAPPKSPFAAFLGSGELKVDPMPEGTASALNSRKLAQAAVMLVAVTIACGSVFWLWQRSQLSTTAASGSAVTPLAKEIPGAVSPPAAQPSGARSAAPAFHPPPNQGLANSAAQPAAGGQINLAIIAREDTWMKITADEKVIFQRLLQRGESTVASASANARILAGNAGGIDVRFNGNDIGQVGPRGQVRIVEFTPDRFTVIENFRKPDATTPAQPVADEN